MFRGVWVRGGRLGVPPSPLLDREPSVPERRAFRRGSEVTAETVTARDLRQALESCSQQGGTLTESDTYWSETRTPKQLAPLPRGWKWRSWGSRTQSYRLMGKREAQPHPDWKEQKLQALSEGTAPIMRWEESQSAGSDRTSLCGPALSGLPFSPDWSYAGYHTTQLGQAP